MDPAILEWMRKQAQGAAPAGPPEAPPDAPTLPQATQPDALRSFLQQYGPDALAALQRSQEATQRRADIGDSLAGSFDRAESLIAGVPQHHAQPTRVPDQVKDWLARRGLAQEGIGIQGQIGAMDPNSRASMLAQLAAARGGQPLPAGTSAAEAPGFAAGVKAAAEPGEIVAKTDVARADTALKVRSATPVPPEAIAAAERSLGVKLSANITWGELKDRADEALKAQGLSQDQWGAVADPAVGGILMFNKKTGETRPMGPGGGSPGAGAVRPKPKDLENDVQALGKDLEDAAKMKHDVEVLANAAKGELPGFGPVAGRMPNITTSPEGIRLRQAAGRLMATKIHMISGAVANQAEVDRLLDANGMSRTATPEQFRTGIASILGELRTVVAQREAKYHPDVVKTYADRGGFTSARLGDTGSGAAGSASAAPEVKSVGAKRYEKRADGWYEVP
jgi:hypothetical protein